MSAVASALDPRAILAGLGVTDATAIVPVFGGWDTALWRVERAGTNGAFALRVYPPGREESCRGELTAMWLAAAAGLPVPRVQAAGQWGDRAAILLSWCKGQPLLHALWERPWRVLSLCATAGRVQATMHAASVPEHLRPIDHSWIPLAGPDEQLLQEHLRALPLRTDGLLHLDYHPLNVMVAGTRVTGVLDWTRMRRRAIRAPTWPAR